jgi:hypothetical protein
MLASVVGLAVLAISDDLLPQGIAPEKAKADPDGKTLWYDGKDIGLEGKGWSDTLLPYDRLPGKAEGKAPPAVWGLSRQSAGLCVRFTTDAPAIQVRWTVTSANLAMPHMPATGVSGVDLYTRDKGGRWLFVGNHAPSSLSTTVSFAPPVGQTCLLYLPLYNGTASLEIGIPKGKTLSKADGPISKRKPIVWYGTSIVQGGCASRPGMAATAIVGRKLDTEVINLGFSGSGRMEPVMGDLLAELDPSVYVLDCLWNMPPKEVADRIEPFVNRLREAHPDTPILLADDSNYQDICPTEKGRILRTCLGRLITAGVKNLHLISSKDMLGEDWEGTVDGCHPNDLGMMRQADAFVKVLGPVLEKK